jgi:biopolymer transport protein ExbB
MPYLTQQIVHIKHFLDLGGYALWAILTVALLILVLFFERWLFLKIIFPKKIIQWHLVWDIREDKQSWSAQRIRDACLAQGLVFLNQYKWLLKVAIAVCPLLGLMGTVSGMILVFDELAFFGTGNPRIMSAGIFKATIPTMAGMLVAIIGLILQNILKRLSRQKHHTLVQSLACAAQRNTQQNGVNA